MTEEIRAKYLENELMCVLGYDTMGRDGLYSIGGH